MIALGVANPKRMSYLEAAYPLTHARQGNPEKDMAHLARSFALALRLAALAPLAAAPIALASSARAQSDAAPAQIQLTDAQVQAYLDAQGEMNAATAKEPEGAGDKPDPKIQAQFEAIAKKHKFASYDDYEQVEANIGEVVDGVDPDTKKYVGEDAVLKKEIAQVQADKSMAAADKKQALEDMNGALKAVQPLKYPGNVDVVLKYLDKLAAASGQTD